MVADHSYQLFCWAMFGNVRWDISFVSSTVCSYCDINMAMHSLSTFPRLHICCGFLVIPTYFNRHHHANDSVTESAAAHIGFSPFTSLSGVCCFRSPRRLSISAVIFWPLGSRLLHVSIQGNDGCSHKNQLLDRLRAVQASPAPRDSLCPPCCFGPVGSRSGSARLAFSPIDLTS